MDIKFGPDGALYVIEWGSGFNGDNADSGIYRIDYVAGDKAPVAQATGTPTTGLAPLTVQFNGDTGSHDPEGGPITYAWDFNGDGNVDSTDPNPSYTYTANGAYTAKLTVKDQTGPDRRREHPDHGRQPRPGDHVRDPDRRPGRRRSPTRCRTRSRSPTRRTAPPATASPAPTSRSPSRSAMTSTPTTWRRRPGCEGTLHTGLTSGHGPEANTFTVITVTYTDKGGPGGIVPLTGRGQVILQPKTKQAEFYASTGRIPGAATTGDPGVVAEDAADVQGGGKDIGFIDDGDYVSYKPVNLSRPQRRCASAWPRRATAARSRSTSTRRPARSWARRRTSPRRAAGRPTRRSRCR